MNELIEELKVLKDYFETFESIEVESKDAVTINRAICELERFYRLYKVEEMMNNREISFGRCSEEIQWLAIRVINGLKEKSKTYGEVIEKLNKIEKEVNYICTSQQELEKEFISYVRVLIDQEMIDLPLRAKGEVI